MVRSGSWNPEIHEQDREQRNAMAARGYWQAFQLVEQSIGKVLKGETPGAVAEQDHRTWYREMFAPSVAAGLLPASDLAGYGNGQVFIRNSMHVPLNKDAVRDAMPAFFDLLRAEEHPAVRVVLGHTCAKLCRAAGGELEQIQLLLGHASVQTTERYLGTKQDLVHAPNDGIKLRIAGSRASID